MVIILSDNSCELYNSVNIRCETNCKQVSGFFLQKIQWAGYNNGVSH